MFREVFERIKQEAKQGPIGFLADLFDVIDDTLSVVGLFLSFLGIFVLDKGNSSGGALSSFSIDFGATPFPLKILFITLIAAAIGWGFATITNWLMERGGEIDRIFSYVLAIACASLLVSGAETLFGPGSSGSILQRDIMVLASLALSFSLARAKFRTSNDLGSHQTLARSDNLLCFSASVLFIYIMTAYL